MILLSSLFHERDLLIRRHLMLQLIGAVMSSLSLRCFGWFVCLCLGGFCFFLFSLSASLCGLA